jgi:3-hydroxy-9,10-secoandrosta-1,3,5(10)-triene-9,17-dione monooxygenase
MTTSAIPASAVGAADTAFTDPVASARAIRPLLSHHRPANDQSRRLTEETIQALRDAGQFRTQVASRFGGLECDLATVVDATAEVTKGDPSAGWVTMILSTADWLVGLFPDQAQREVYQTGPDTRVCAVIAPRGRPRTVAEGWLVDGRWSPSSGCHHCEWAILGVLLADLPGEPARPVLALVPMAELSIEDTWHTLGMRATASNTLAGRAVFVPRHRVLPLHPAVEGIHSGANPGQLFRSAMMPTMVTHMTGPYLGMAEAALEHVLDTVPDRPVTFTNYARKSESTAFQLAIAQAAIRIDAARALAHRAAQVVDQHAAARTFPEPVERARIRGWAGHIVAECRAAVDLLASAHGASAFSEQSLLCGIVRDIHTASRHAMANAEINAEIYGKALLGVTPNISALV